MSRRTACVCAGLTALLIGAASTSAEQLFPDNVPPLANQQFVNETPKRWFVELTSAPTADGGSLTTIKQEKSAFRTALKNSKLPVAELKAYDNLFNGFSLSSTAADIARVKRLPGVVAVYPVRTHAVPTVTMQAAPELFYALAQTGADIAQSELGLSGVGVKVAIIDTGINYLHPDLGGCFGPGCKVAYGRDFVGDAYYDDSSSDSYSPIPQPDADPLDCNGHGSHVAGIVAASGFVRGVAPGATLGAYKVFGCDGTTSSDVLLAAMEQVLADGMQVLNMSVGDAFEWPAFPTAKAATRLVNKGVVVVASNGNAGTDGLYAGSAPAVADKVIAVAAFNNGVIRESGIELQGVADPIPFQPVQGAPSVVLETSGDFARLKGSEGCNRHGHRLPEVNGKIALVKRGGPCSFYEKAKNLQDAGAAGVVIANNKPGKLVNVSVGKNRGGADSSNAADEISIPVVTIEKNDGAKIEGRILTLTEGRILADAQGRILTDTDGRILSDPEGIFLVDAQGRILGRILTDAEGRILTGPDGRILSAEEGRILADQLGRILAGFDGGYLSDLDGRILSELYQSYLASQSETVSEAEFAALLEWAIETLYLVDMDVVADVIQLRWTLRWIDASIASSELMAGLVSGFSSYGVSPDLALKPDIGAPGGNVFSTYANVPGAALFDGQPYAISSGTSMASPHVAGAVALLLEAKPDTSSQEVRARLANSADAHQWWGDQNQVEMTHRQGAGMLDIDNAVLSDTLIQPGKLSFGESENGPVSRRLSVRNEALVTQTYALSARGTATTGPDTVADQFFTSHDSVSFAQIVTVDGAMQAIPVTAISLAPGSTATIEITVAADTSLFDGSLHSGFIDLVSDKNASYSVPYVGYKGDYQTRVALTPTDKGFPWLARLDGSSYLKVNDSVSFTLAGGDVPYFLLHFDHQVRRLRLDVTDAFSGKAWHRALDTEYLARHANSEGFTAYAWDGKTVAGGKTYTVPNGRYRVEVSVLKALGDELNPAHWEKWSAPEIVINR